MQTGLSASRQQRAIHDVNIDISLLWVAKRAWQSTNDLETELLPKVDRRCVGRNDKIELHCAKPEPARLPQTMFAHRAANSLSPRVRCNHERRISDMRAGTSLIR